ALKEAIQGYFDDLLPIIQTLEEAVFSALPTVPEPKAEPSPFRYTAASRRVVDAAIDLFLNEMAGPERSREGFVEGGMESDTPDGVIQLRNVFSFAVGARRGADLLNAAQTVTAGRQSPAVRQMLDSAFTRLSENGKLRLEGVRDEIHGILVSATDAGLGPLDVARQLRNRFDAYKGYEFERLARTEAAFAAEAATREQLSEYGVSLVKILLAAGACPICQGYENQLIPIEETDSLPPYHPNCACSVVAA
ncbi:MAG TPA: hypothetical protein VIM84_14395, partial [Gemmatimonadales bacterium]